MFSFPFYSILFFVAGALLLTIAAVLWSRRPAQGLIPFSLFLYAAALWSVFAGLEGGAISLHTRILATQVQYIGIVSSGVLWLFFALDYTGRTWWKRPRAIILFSLLPLIVLALAWTNEWHHLIWSGVSLAVDNGLVYSVWGHGPLYLVDPIYQYSLYAAGFFILLVYGLKQPPFYRRQLLIVLAGTSLPFIYNILYVLGYSPVKGMDMTPFFLFAGALVYTITILRFRFFNVLPVAYRTLVDSLPDSILIMDMQDRLIELNPSAEKLLSFHKRTLKGQSVHELWPELALLLPLTDQGNSGDLSLAGPAGPHFFTANQVILRNSQGNPVGKLVTIRDVTELKTIHKELEAEIQKRSQYSRALVHELRSPLTSIIASSDLLDSIVKEPMQHSLTQNIQRSAHNLDRRVAELFELARGEVGLLKIEPVEMDLCLLIEEVIAEISPVAERKGLALEGECSPGLKVLGDRSRLHQVISNLLSNAIKFTEKGRIRVQLSVTDKGLALVQVSDSGQGIPAEQMPELFDPYRRKTPSGRDTAGLGIGLALSKIIIELHQGKIWAESVSGQGATLSFTLPLLNK